MRSTQCSAYNAADQLASVILPNNTSITYAYDADGRRVKQTVGSTVTNYQWDEASAYGDVVNEYNSSGTLASYVPSISLRAGLGSTGLISQTRGMTNNPINAMDPSGHNFVEYVPCSKVVSTCPGPKGAVPGEPLREHKLRKVTY